MRYHKKNWDSSRVCCKFASASYKWRAFDQKDVNAITLGNNASFNEGYSFPKGPLKYMSPEDKEKVHLLAEMRLQELEDTK